MIVASDYQSALISLGQVSESSQKYLSLTVRLLDSDLALLLGEELSPTQSAILSGLLNTKRLASLSDVDIDSDFEIEGLDDLKRRYAKLAYCCEATIIHGEGFAPAEVDKYRERGIKAIHIEKLSDEVINTAHVNNIVMNWDLVDNGQIEPIIIMKKYFEYVKSVIIYDRYFGEEAILGLENIIAGCGPMPVKWSLEIYIGSGVQGWGPNNITARLSHYFEAGKIAVYRSSKPPGQKHYVHDRYIQIDRRITIELSAGMSCFYDSAGNIHNRTASVLVRNLAVGRSVVTLLRLPGATPIDLFR